MKIATAFLLLLTIATSTLIAQQHEQGTQISPSRPEMREQANIDRTITNEASLLSFAADPNETTPEIARIYKAVDDLLSTGKWKTAAATLETALAKYPESRHLKKQMAEFLWYNYELRTRQRQDLDLAADQAVKAFESGFRFGIIDEHSAWLVAQTIGRLGAADVLERTFTPALATVSDPELYLDYARGLSLAGDPRAEDAFRASLELKATQNPASIELAEWFLDQGRTSEALSLLNQYANEEPTYAHFLRGVALERLGHNKVALSEYKIYSQTSRSFPAPGRFKSQKSKVQVQSGVRFNTLVPPDSEGSLINKISSAQAQIGISFLIAGEAIGESPGGQRAVGWTVRTRVLRGAVKDSSGSGCPAVSNSGATLYDQYKSVICQTGQFDGKCPAWCSDPTITSSSACQRNAFTNDVALAVINGTAPDPVGMHCPGGVVGGSGNYCDSSTVCRGETKTYKIRGSLFNYGILLSQTTTCPSIVCPAAQSQGRVCSDAGSRDNCFYTNPYWKESSYVGFISAQGQTQYQPNGTYFQDPLGTPFAHLEGPESSDFDLALYWWNGSAWQNVAQSARFGSVEDISYSGSAGYYMWAIYAYTGNGGYTLWTKP